MLRRVALSASCAMLCILAMGCSAHRMPAAKSDRQQPAISASSGRAIYAERCAACHGSTGSGGQIGPSLIGVGGRKSRAQIVEAIEHPTPPMPKLEPSQMNASDVASVAAFVEQL